MGKIYVMGIGPGNRENMTEACLAHLKAADIIVGYTGYTELVRPIFPDKGYYETGMMQEVERCKAAIEFASGGKNICVI